MTKRLSCTCKNKNEPVKHTKKCALQKSAQFVSGKLVWNMYQDRLTTKAVAIDDEVANDKLAAQAEMAALAEEEIDLADYPSCPTCNSDINVDCATCGKEWLDCICGMQEPQEWYCKICGTMFSCALHYDIDDELDAGGLSMEADAVATPCGCVPQKTYCWTCGVQQNYTTKTWKFIEKTSVATTYIPKCRHYNKPITLPDGVIIHVSSLQNKRTDEDIIPDWGLYLDYSWHPTWRSEHINWPDYSIPLNYEAAAEAIVYAYDFAKLEGIVEIGCIGGHGRTGTALACMAILGGVPAEEVVDWVHKNHCTHAIESKKQEWFPLWFDAYLKGTEPPPMPVETYISTTTSSFCTKKEHHDMWAAGQRSCTKDGDKCKWWREDILELGEDPGSAPVNYNCNPDDHEKQWRLGVEKCPKDCQWWDGDVKDLVKKPVINVTVTSKPEVQKGVQQCLPTAPKEHTHILIGEQPGEWKPLVTKYPCAGCKTSIRSGTEQCPNCQLSYAPKYWTDKEALAKRPSCPKVGTSSGDFIFTSKGWISKQLFNKKDK